MNSTEEIPITGSAGAGPAAGPAAQEHRYRRGRARRGSRRLGRHESIALSVAVFVVLVAIWWAVTAAGMIAPTFLPAPGNVLSSLKDQASNGQLWSDVGISTRRVLLAFVLAAVMAIPAGALIGRFPAVEAMFEPLMQFTRYLPVVAFVPLTIVWAGIGESQKLTVIWIGTFFPLVLMVMDSVRRVPADLTNVGRTLGMPGHRILRQIVLRSALPEIWDSLRIIIGWAWSWVVLAELVAADSGMGYRITLAQRYFDTDLMIAYVLVLGLLGLVTDQFFKLSGRKLFHYQPGRAS